MALNDELRLKIARGELTELQAADQVELDRFVKGALEVGKEAASVFLPKVLTKLNLPNLKKLFEGTLVLSDVFKEFSDAVEIFNTTEAVRNAFLEENNNLAGIQNKVAEAYKDRVIIDERLAVIGNKIPDLKSYGLELGSIDFGLFGVTNFLAANVQAIQQARSILGTAIGEIEAKAQSETARLLEENKGKIEAAARPPFPGEEPLIPPLQPPSISAGPAAPIPLAPPEPLTRFQRTAVPELQSGGPLNGNQIALVGEKGPELFIPDRPGLILSNEDSKRFMGAFADGGIVGAGLAAFGAFQGGGGGLGGLAAAFQAGNAELGGGGFGGGLEGLGGILGEGGILGGPLFGTDEQGNPLTLEGVLSAQSDLFQGLLDQKTLFDGLFLEQESAHQGEMDAAAQEGQQGRLQKTKQGGSALNAAIGVSQQLSESLMQSGSKKMFAVGKALAIGNAVMDTFRGAQSAFAAYANLPIVGPIIGAAAAGVAIAAGIQRVNQIRSQKFGGGAVGGGAGGSVPRPSIGAPGGPGGGATPELPQQQQAGPPQRNIAISITSDRGVVTTDWIRDQLIPSLNNALGDGVQIDVTATRQLT